MRLWGHRIMGTSHIQTLTQKGKLAKVQGLLVNYPHTSSSTEFKHLLLIFFQTTGGKCFQLWRQLGWYWFTTGGVLRKSFPKAPSELQGNKGMDSTRSL